MDLTGKKKCGVDEPVQDSSSSPGYNHATYWPVVLKEEEEFFNSHSLRLPSGEAEESSSGVLTSEAEGGAERGRGAGWVKFKRCTQ